MKPLFVNTTTKNILILFNCVYTKYIVELRLVPLKHVINSSLQIWTLYSILSVQNTFTFCIKTFTIMELKPNVELSSLSALQILYNQHACPIVQSTHTPYNTNRYMFLEFPRILINITHWQLLWCFPHHVMDESV